MSDETRARETRWRSADGGIIACVEKLKMLRENLEEIEALCQDAIDDAVLMGCQEAQFREVLGGLVARLRSAYPAKPG